MDKKVEASSLVIVDVQPAFAAAKKIVNEVVKEAVKFRRLGAPIFLVEYGEQGRSYAEIIDVLAGYKNAHLIIKDHNDGSFEIIEKANERNIPLNNVKICGVNVCYCVQETATGLLHYGIQVKLVERALWCHSSVLKHDVERCIAATKKVLSDTKLLEKIK